MSKPGVLETIDYQSQAKSAFACSKCKQDQQRKTTCLTEWDRVAGEGSWKKVHSHEQSHHASLPSAASCPVPCPESASAPLHPAEKGSSAAVKQEPKSKSREWATEKKETYNIFHTFPLLKLWHYLAMEVLHIHLQINTAPKQHPAKGNFDNKNLYSGKPRTANMEGMIRKK